VSYGARAFDELGVLASGQGASNAVRASSSNGNESSDVVDGKHRRLKRFLYVGLALVAVGVVWRVVSLMSAFSVVSSALPADEKQEALTAAIGSVGYAMVPMAVGALLIAGSAARLIVLAFTGNAPRSKS